jgi:F-type H+-transporting ATPase subunit b
MVSINLTLLIEMGLFVLFLWVTKRFLLGPLVRVMDDRAAGIARDEADAAKDGKDAELMELTHRARITEAHQSAARRIHEARYEANREVRHAFEARLKVCEESVEQYRMEIDRQRDAERVKYADMMPVLMEAMDRRIHSEGRLL